MGTGGPWGLLGKLKRSTGLHARGGPCPQPRTTSAISINGT